MSRVDQKVDQGLPPPPGKRATLTEEHQQAISMCPDDDKTRPFFFTFVGNLNRDGKIRNPNPHFHARSDLKRFHDVNAGILVMEARAFAATLPNVTFEDLLIMSKYSATPRGHSKFSYRFSEVMSGGSIPVILADDWLLPFRPEVADWEKCKCCVRKMSVG
jgi:hypothetical protein